jgi:tetratricopeptide (TPR) repeat protein
MLSTPQALLDEGYKARRENRTVDAKAHFAAALEMSRKAGDRVLVARSLAGLGQIERDLGNLDAARKHYQDAAGFHRALGDPLSVAHALRHAGDILRKLKKTDQAAVCYVEAVAMKIIPLTQGCPRWED